MDSCLRFINWDERLKQFGGNKRVALYGAGKYGRNALENIRKYLPQLEIVCFLDDNKLRNNGKIEGIEVLSLNEAMEQAGEFHILITNYYILPVWKRIEACEFDVDKVFFWSELLIEDFEETLLKENKEKLEQSYQYLSDYQSKQIFRNMIEARSTKSIALFARTCQQNQYFPEDIFHLGREEVFVDAGAFDGDTIQEFLNQTGGNYKYIYAFEPDKMNYEKLINRNFGGNTLIHQAGLYSETDELCFAAGKGGSSKIEEGASETIQVYRFDEMELPDQDITFVKMDIEGSELSALHGMETTIKRCRPKLAICMYHKLEDLWELPLYLKELVPEYKLYIRNYTTYLDEIVLYAVV